jgi:hypothetical protein
VLIAVNLVKDSLYSALQNQQITFCGAVEHDEEYRYQMASEERVSKPGQRGQMIAFWRMREGYSIITISTLWFTRSPAALRRGGSRARARRESIIRSSRRRGRTGENTDSARDYPTAGIQETQGADAERNEARGPRDVTARRTMKGEKGNGKRKTMKAESRTRCARPCRRSQSRLARRQKTLMKSGIFEGTDRRCPRCGSIRTERLSGLLKCRGSIYH